MLIPQGSRTDLLRLAGALLLSAISTASNAAEWWSETFIGGSEADGAVAIAKVPGEEAWIIVGQTNSDDFPTTPGAFKPNRTERFSPDGVMLSTGPEGVALKVVRLALPRFVPSVSGPIRPSGWPDFVVGLVWSTYLGEQVLSRDVAVDGQGNVYIAGLYNLSFERPSLEPRGDLPVNGDSFDSTPNGSADGFLLKLSGDGSEALYATVIGGGDNDQVAGVGVTADGSAFVAGSTTSANFFSSVESSSNAEGATVRRIGLPVPIGGLDDGFVMRFGPQGDLVYGTLIGGSAADGIRDLAVDALGRAYIVGSTYSKPFTPGPPFPTTPGVFQTTPPFQTIDNSRLDLDAFVARLEGDGSLSYSTLLAGSNSDAATAVSLEPPADAAVGGPRLVDTVYVTGSTRSNDFIERPTNLAGLSDVFVAVLCCGGRDLLFSDVIGGAGYDHPTGIDVNGLLEVNIVGWTESPDFPLTSEAVDSQITFLGTGGEVRVETRHDARRREPFVFKLSRDTHEIAYSTFLGGSAENRDQGNALGAYFDGSSWRVLVTGRVRSDDFPRSGNPFRPGTIRSSELFVVDLPMSR